MKNILVVIPFIFAFILVTGALVYLNEIYTNIFQFDFTPRASQQSAKLDSLAIKDSLKLANQSQPLDTLKASKDTMKIDLTNVMAPKSDTLNTLASNTNEQNNSIQRVSNNVSNSKELKDSAYTVWLKKTVKLVENLPPAQASKLLKNFSDNQARDIIFNMKQKQAAKIISYLEPEYVYKITRFQ
ncbi:MAG: hypothetical protein NZM09_00375 [Ignavibacterium sp.]|nr:hypothetical protein [Ignavibacterium sp.]MDW8374125.1 hypothetical protein [Ignavibacteriales bacterium]